jgi:hypothetical protein
MRVKLPAHLLLLPPLLLLQACLLLCLHPHHQRPAEQAACSCCCCWIQVPACYVLPLQPPDGLLPASLLWREVPAPLRQPLLLLLQVLLLKPSLLLLS